MEEVEEVKRDSSNSYVNVEDSNTIKEEEKDTLILELYKAIEDLKQAHNNRLDALHIESNQK